MWKMYLLIYHSGSLNNFGSVLNYFFMLWFNDIVYVEVLRPSQPNVVMSSAVSLPNYTFTGQSSKP